MARHSASVYSLLFRFLPSLRKNFLHQLVDEHFVVVLASAEDTRLRSRHVTRPIMRFFVSFAAEYRVFGLLILLACLLGYFIRSRGVVFLHCYGVFIVVVVVVAFGLFTASI